MISRANFQSPQNCCGCTLRGPVSEQQSKSFKAKIPVDTKPDNKDSFRKAQNRNLLNTAAAPQVQAGLYGNTNANIEAQIIQNII